MNTPHLCPKCHGQKIVSTPPWVPGDVWHYGVGTAVAHHPCPVCAGVGVLWSIEPPAVAEPSQTNENVQITGSSTVYLTASLEQMHRDGLLSYTGGAT